MTTLRCKPAELVWLAAQRAQQPAAASAGAALWPQPALQMRLAAALPPPAASGLPPAHLILSGPVTLLPRLLAALGLLLLHCHVVAALLL